MINIDTFAEKVLQDIPGDVITGSLNVSACCLHRFIATAYYASLIPDETRWPRAHLDCFSELPSAIKDAIYFAEPQPITAIEVAKLAQAFGYGSRFICVAHNDQILIHGVSLAHFPLDRHLGYASFRTGSKFGVRIVRPGEIEVLSVAGASIYRCGALFDPSLLLHSEIAKRLASQITKAMRPLASGTVEILPDVVNDIAALISRKGHGGTLIFSPEPSKTYFASMRQIQSQILHQALNSFWASAKALQDDAGNDGNLLTPEARDYPNAPIVAEHTERIEQCVRSIAQLSGMDGAIVLDLRCIVYAFNAVIDMRADVGAQVDPNALHWIELPDDRAIAYGDVIRNKGARHQSALSYVINCSGAFAFVMSQDGAISAFHNAGHGKILLQRDLRALESDVIIQ